MFRFKVLNQENYIGYYGGALSRINILNSVAEVWMLAIKNMFAFGRLISALP